MSDDRATQVRGELNEMVISAELTLISIIQGAALYFLVNTSIETIVNANLQYWLYTVAGLFVIFIVWSRTLMHTFTIVGWPLEFGHNFLYITITMLEAVMFTQIADPLRWFLLGTAFWFLALLIFAFDMRLIHSLQASAEVRSGSYELAVATEREQRMNIRFILPVVVIGYGASAVAIFWWPGLFVDNKGHVLLASGQLIGLAGYLWYSLTYYRRILPLIELSRSEMT